MDIMSYERFKKCAEFYAMYQYLPLQDIFDMKNRCHIYRNLKGLTQNDIAKEIGVCRFSYVRFETQGIVTLKILRYFIDNEEFKRMGER